VTNPDWEGFGGVGDYARSHGNTWEAMMAAHDLRDGKQKDADSRAVDSGERYDLIIVGGGLSGLGARISTRSSAAAGCWCSTITRWWVERRSAMSSRWMVLT
jgi:spermidine dehydrogenase